MDRDYVYYEYTNSLCNECLKVIPTKIIFKDTKVYLLKHCSEHGEQLELLEHDIDYFKHKRDFDKAGTITKTQTEVKHGCPYDCGLCPNHDQHSCINLIEVTNKCNMCCNTCYAGSGKGKDKDLNTIKKMIDFAADAELSITEQIAKHRPNDKVKISAKRDGKVKLFEVTLRNKAGKTDLLTKEDIDALCEALGEALKTLVRIR